MLGMFPPLTTAWSLATVSSLPTTSFRSWGRYFSTQGCVDIVLVRARGGGVGAGALARGGAGSLRRARAVLSALPTLPKITNAVCWRPAVGAVELLSASRDLKLGRAGLSASVLRRHLRRSRAPRAMECRCYDRRPSDLNSPHGAESSAETVENALLKHAT